MVPPLAERKIAIFAERMGALVPGGGREACGLSAPAAVRARSGRRPEAALELPDQALELAHTLAQGRVFSLEAGECGGRRLGTRLSPLGDAAARGTDALRAAARQEAAADRAQTGP
jgi:hypothetical protein